MTPDFVLDVSNLCGGLVWIDDEKPEMNERGPREGEKRRGTVSRVETRYDDFLSV